MTPDGLSTTDQKKQTYTKSSKLMRRSRPNSRVRRTKHRAKTEQLSEHHPQGIIKTENRREGMLKTTGV